MRLALTEQPVSVENDRPNLPQQFILLQNHPNRFNAETRIRFALPEPSAVTLQIFNSAGHLVCTRVVSNFAACYHQVTWNATDDDEQRVASGVYIYMLGASSLTKQQKLLLMW